MTSKTSVSLGASVDVTTAQSLYKRLSAALEKSPNVELKAEAVQKADTAGLQLIMSFKRELIAHGGSIKWIKPSKELVDSAQLLDMFEELGFHY